MASAKQRGEKIMVFGTDEFLDASVLQLSGSELRLKTAAELIIFQDESIPPSGATILAYARHCVPQYMTDDEFRSIVQVGYPVPDYMEIRFMFACFIYQALGGEI